MGRDGPEAAPKIAHRICEGVDKLAPFPNRGRPGRKEGAREGLFPGLPFLAVYRVRAKVIEFSRMLHGAQKWP